MFRAASALARGRAPAPSAPWLRARFPPSQEFASLLHIRIRPAPDHSTGVERRRHRGAEGADANPFFECDRRSAYQFGGLACGVGSHGQIITQWDIPVKRGNHSPAGGTRVRPHRAGVRRSGPARVRFWRPQRHRINARGGLSTGKGPVNGPSICGVVAQRPAVGRPEAF